MPRLEWRSTASRLTSRGSLVRAQYRPWPGPQQPSRLARVVPGRRGDCRATGLDSGSDWCPMEPVRDGFRPPWRRSRRGPALRKQRSHLRCWAKSMMLIVVVPPGSQCSFGSSRASCHRVAHHDDQDQYRAPHFLDTIAIRADVNRHLRSIDSPFAPPSVSALHELAEDNDPLSAVGQLRQMATRVRDDIGLISTDRLRRESRSGSAGFLRGGLLLSCPGRAAPCRRSLFA